MTHASREPASTRRWRAQAELHQRNVQRLMFQNAQLITIVGALLPALFDAPAETISRTCVICGISLPPQGKLYCSQRCNQRAWRARKAA